jgi:hypothetical protein
LGGVACNREGATRGIYNIAEPSGYLSTGKAERELGFDADVQLNAQSTTQKFLSILRYFPCLQLRLACNL